MTQPLRFALYPGGEIGSDNGLTLGVPDSLPSLLAAVAQLQPPTAPLILRLYERFQDSEPQLPPTSPRDLEPLLEAGYPLDFVLQFNSRSGDVRGFCEFVRRRAVELGPRLYSMQITEEANFVHGPECIDGPYPHVLQALVDGVVAGRQSLDQAGFPQVPVGFSVSPTFGPDAGFWSELGALGSSDFATALGYVALDFFPDVFAPLTADPGDVMTAVLRILRNEWLPGAGIGAATPIHIGEWGWPTGRNRTEKRQAEVTESVLRSVQNVRAEVNLQRLSLFALRDAVTARQDDIFCGFGFLRDDYTPKPAFDVCRRLIAEFG